MMHQSFEEYSENNSVEGISMVIATTPVPAATPEESSDSETSCEFQGRLIAEECDHLQLMTSYAGLNALRIFARVGEVAPLYVSREFMDSISA